MSISSQGWLRGYSTSDGHPIASLDLTYDAPNGLYAAASGSVLASAGDGLRPHAFEVDGGYAKRVSSSITIDVGASHSIYSRYLSLGPGRSYSQVYADISGKLLSARLSFSPNYFRAGASALYGEVNGHLPIGSRTQVEGHAGLLARFNYGQLSGSRDELDWRVGVTRNLGRLSLRAAWVSGAPRSDISGLEAHRRTVFIASLSYPL